MTVTRSTQGAMWPLAGSEEFGRAPGAWRERLADGLLSDLRRHVVDAWFPRTVEPEGGFLCDFDSRWADVGPHDRLLEFQVRQTRTAARVGIAFEAESARWQEIARHGLRFVRERMEDRDYGGWFARIDRSGRPQLGGSKHAHGVAYLIGAAADAFRLTGDGEALELAKQAFAFLDDVFHDGQHGGYFGWATRDGRPILSPADLPEDLADHTADPLGHGLGLKDANVHSDLLEALRLLAELWPDETVVARLAETYDVVAHRFGTPQGAIHLLVYPDLTPVPALEPYGYVFQSAFRLPSAASACARSADDAWATARLMLEHGVAWAWDARRGGFLEAGPASEPSRVTGIDIYVRKRPWWVQTEGAKLLLLGAVRIPDGAKYRDLFEQLLRVIDAEFIDHRYGGWERIPRREVPMRTRISHGPLPKGDVWKDASHEADMYLACIRMLRGLGANDPLDRPVNAQRGAAR